MKISFVIPCYRSENTIEKVVDEIISTVSKRGDEYEVVMISDCSPDNVFRVIKSMCKDNHYLKAAELSKNFGQHSALMAGYSMCTGDIIVSVDDDGQIPIDETYSLIDIMNEGYDVVYGRYDEKHYNMFRQFGSRINSMIMESFLHKPKTIDITSFFAAKKYVIDEILKYNNAYPFVVGLVLRTTNKIGNVSVKHRSRQSGRSGYNLKKLISLWLNGFTAFSVKPLRIASIAGVISALIGFIFVIYTVVNKIVHPDVPMGYSSLMAVLLIVGGIIMVILGLIGEYIGRIYICLNNSPQYVIREKINLDSEVNGDEKS